MKHVRFPPGGGRPVETTEPLRLLELTNPFSVGHGKLCLLEPVNISLSVLRQQLVDGSYDKPFIVDDGKTLSLHFGLTYVQSSMWLDDPNGLRLRYTQKMMGFRLFAPAPHHITLIGLGGGSLAKHCYQHLPASTITAVEIDPYVTALREHFKIPPDDARFRVILDDGRHHLNMCQDAIDVLLVDAYDGKGLASTITGRDFLELAYDRLADTGMLVMNLAGNAENYQEIVAQTENLFQDQVLVIPVGRDGNYVMYAFKDAQHAPDWLALRKQARRLCKTSSVDYFFLGQLLEAAALRNRVPWRR